jgi:hypothetical protein
MAQCKENKTQDLAKEMQAAVQQSADVPESILVRILLQKLHAIKQSQLEKASNPSAVRILG